MQDSAPDMLDRETFQGHLREALGHLYEPHCLRRSPLAALFGVADRPDTPSALQRILVEAIEALKPGPSEPAHSPAWALYIPLSYRFVEQLGQEEVAHQMAISTRHLRRRERAALQALGDLLWDQFGLDFPMAPFCTDDEAGDEPDGLLAPTPQAVAEELGWLADRSEQHRTSLREALPSIVELARRLASGYGVQFETDIATGLPDLACDPVALRQVLINLITVVVPRASGGLVHLTVQPLGWEVLLRLQCAAYPSGPKPALSDETERLNIAQELARLSGGRLLLDVDARAFDATAIYPAVEQLPVLVVDDNADTLELLQRYAAGSRYHLITTRDPEAALALAEEHAPQIIVLDVMMPGVDGWTVLAQLQQHPVTSHIPVVVCTVLPQKDLALFLGASGFLRKPLTRQEFLVALDQQSVRPAAESH